MSTFGCDGVKVRTRKKHQCQTCLRPIPAGKEAIHVKGMFEGDWQNWYMCIPCHDNEVFEGGEWISGDEFREWLMNQPEYECNHPHGIGSDGNRRCHLSYHIDWEWSEDEETVEFECTDCGHKWSKYIGFGGDIPDGNTDTAR